MVIYVCHPSFKIRFGFRIVLVLFAMHVNTKWDNVFAWKINISYIDYYPLIHGSKIADMTLDNNN